MSKKKLLDGFRNILYIQDLQEISLVDFDSDDFFFSTTVSFIFVILREQQL